MTERATDTIEITIDRKTTARDAWGVWAAKERALTFELERTPVDETTRRNELEASIAEVKAHQEKTLNTIREGIATLTVRALSRGEYRNLMKNHAPRPDDEADQALGYNTDTFAAALLRTATVSAKNLNGTEVPLKVDAWVDDETGVDAAEFEAWFTTALALNKPGASSFPPLRAS